MVPRLIEKNLSPVIAGEFRGGHYTDRKKKLRRFQKSMKDQSGTLIKDSIKQGSDNNLGFNIIFFARLYKIGTNRYISSRAIWNLFSFSQNSLIWLSYRIFKYMLKMPLTFAQFAQFARTPKLGRWNLGFMPKSRKDEVFHQIWS